MKKIAIIVDSHTGSTLPLCKEFAKKYEIHYYFISVGHIHSPEGADIEYNNKIFGIHEIPKLCYPLLNNYLDSPNIKLFAIVLPRPYVKIPIIRNIMRFSRDFFLKVIANKINRQNYAFINLVGRYNTEEFIPIIEKNKGRAIVSLHEVGNHMESVCVKTPRFLHYLFTNNIEIVVHSKKSREDILHYSEVNEKKIHHINFGIFSSFEIYDSLNELKLPEKYFLFIGKVTKYKGIKTFIDAAIRFSTNYQDVKFVIAGNGFDENLERVKDDERFVVYNRYLSNTEFIELIKKAHCVVCPYITMSQSGIPQTAYVYNKPIIASDLLGFREVIEDSVNGFLYKPQDVVALVQKMEMSLDMESYFKLCDNIKNFESFYKDYSWKYISEQYVKIFD